MEINKLDGNQKLSVNERLTSNDGRCSLVMQGDGNLVLYFFGNEAKWSSRTNGSGYGCIAMMQDDGNFVVKNSVGWPKWSSRTNGNPGARIVLQNDGNLVIYKGSRALWASNTNDLHPMPRFTIGTGNKLKAGEGLNPNDTLSSSIGSIEMKMRSDGNLALSFKNGRRAWLSRIGHMTTRMFGGYSVMMQADGNLVIHNKYGRPIWFTRTSGNPGAYLILQDDGNAVIYDRNNKAKWSTKTMMYETLNGGDAIRFNEKIRWDSDLLGGGYGGKVSVTVHRDGKLEYLINARKKGIQNYKFLISMFLDNGLAGIAFQKKGSLRGLGTVKKEISETDNSQIVATSFDTIKREGRLRVAKNFQGGIMGTIENAVQFVLKYGYLGRTISKYSPILPHVFVGVELGSLAYNLFRNHSSGGASAAARVIAGTLWLKGPHGTLFSVVAEGVSRVSSKSRQISQEEYDLAKVVFKSSIPPRNKIIITNQAGLDGRAYVFPRIDGSISINVREINFNNLIRSPHDRFTFESTFIHEMVHVCQCYFWGQDKFILNAVRDSLYNECCGDAYDYTDDGTLRNNFKDYKLEQQASIVEEWYVEKVYRDSQLAYPLNPNKHRKIDELPSIKYNNYQYDDATNFINSNVRVGQY